MGDRGWPIEYQSTPLMAATDDFFHDDHCFYDMLS
jgi:hypothetical protein